MTDWAAYPDRMLRGAAGLDYSLVGILAARDEIKSDADAVTLAERLTECGYRGPVDPAHLERIRADIAAADARARDALIRQTRLDTIDEILAIGAPFERIQPGINWGVSAVRLRAHRAEIEAGRR
jgi:hypothetical protein